MFLTAIKKEKD